MEFNIIPRINKRNQTKKSPKVHAIARRRKLQKERRSKVRGNRETTIKQAGFYHPIYLSVDAEFDKILIEEHESALTQNKEAKKENKIYQKYLQFLENNRSPFENRRIENMISFDAYKNALDAEQKRVVVVGRMIDAFYRNHQFNEDDDSDIECKSECDYDLHCRQYSLFMNPQEASINDLLFNYERQNWAKCDDEEECDCPRCTQKREEKQEQEALLDMCHPRNKVKSARCGLLI